MDVDTEPNLHTIAGIMVGDGQRSCDTNHSPHLHNYVHKLG